MAYCTKHVRAFSEEDGCSKCIAEKESVPLAKQATEKDYDFHNLECSKHKITLTAKGECVDCTKETFADITDAAVKEERKELTEHPPHYNFGEIEVSDFIEDQELPWPAANVLKYICRFRHKGDPLGDLYKAKEYLERQIRLTESEE